MPYISNQELLGGLPNCTPEFKLLINWFYATFDNHSVANRTITNVEPFYYQGVTGGSEFVTYAATKLYIVHNVIFSTTAANIPNTTPNSITLYDAGNAINSLLHNYASYWNGTTNAVNYSHNNVVCNDIYFSRVTTGQYSYMIFNGYRITLT